METSISKFAPYAIGGVVGLVILAHFSHSAALRESRADCLTQNSAARCECITAIVGGRISFLADMPLFGRLFAPSADRIQELQEKALRSCH